MSARTPMMVMVAELQPTLPADNKSRRLTACGAGSVLSLVWGLTVAVCSGVTVSLLFGGVPAAAVSLAGALGVVSLGVWLGTDLAGVGSAGAAAVFTGDCFAAATGVCDGAWAGAAATVCRVPYMATTKVSGPLLW